jgi:uncharacterized protein (DUF4213/DUF364 family)
MLAQRRTHESTRDSTTPMDAEADGPASFAERIVADLSQAARAARVTDVRIGLGYTAVVLDDGAGGVAYTFRDLATGGCSVFRGIRPLAGRPACDLLVLLRSRDPIEAAVGLACANALANHDVPHTRGDVLEHVELRREDRVAMVGHFGPLVSDITERVRTLTVFERVDRRVGLLHPAEEAAAGLAESDVALVTSTAIVNHTIDGLLEAAAGCREVVLLGASTPLVPGAFVGSGVTMLSGVVVHDAAAVLRTVSEGGGMRFFKPLVHKVSVRVPDAASHAAAAPHPGA